VAHAAPQPAPALRRLLAGLGRERAPLAIGLWSSRDDAGRELAAAVAEILARGDALTIGELAIGGADLMKELDLAPGRAIGQILAGLLEQVLDDPAQNQRDALLAAARALR
jgi:tRNA nucleotidyltransferase (CCA-adding enzyme)